ncbi:MAG TPA: hypothetical protein VGF85_08435 [Opitutaceae bacterium]|jgi:hypothetical protein
MIPHVHQALAQVRVLRRYVIEKQRFRGYSGRARAISGCLALAASAWLSRRPERDGNYALFVWLAVAVVASTVNFGAVGIWFLGEAAAERKPSRLKPALEVLPALTAGAALTLAFWRDGAFDYLVPVWLLLFGIANLASRHVLSRGIAWVGLFYMAAGLGILFGTPRAALGNPWPMGFIFFIGEWAGGLITYLDRLERPRWQSFFGFNDGSREHEQTGT